MICNFHQSKECSRIQIANTPNFIRNAFWNYQEPKIKHKLKFITVDFTAQMQYFNVRVPNFEPSYLAGSIRLERAAGLLEEDENQDGCSDLRAH